MHEVKDEIYRFSDKCKDCFRKMCMTDYFAVKNELWKAYSDCPRDMICINCFEIRLGRNLVLDDFKEERMAFSDEILKGRTPQEFRFELYRESKRQIV
jgi:hypothetical protein